MSYRIGSIKLTLLILHKKYESFTGNFLSLIDEFLLSEELKHPVHHISMDIELEFAPIYDTQSKRFLHYYLFHKLIFLWD